MLRVSSGNRTRYIRTEPKAYPRSTETPTQEGDCTPSPEEAYPGSVPDTPAQPYLIALAERDTINSALVHGNSKDNSKES